MARILELPVDYTKLTQSQRRDIAKVQSGEYRIISAKRARKLRRRDERVWWSNGVQGLVWSPWWARKDGITRMNPLPPNT